MNAPRRATNNGNHPSKGHPATILIADDHDSTRRVFALALRRSGHVIHEVERGDAVLAAVATTQPDAIVLDHHMPGKTGAELLNELRLSPATRRLPIVVATGDLIPEALVPNGDPLTCYLSKPVDLHELTSTIDYLINHAEMLVKEQSRSVRRTLRVATDQQTTFERALRAAQHGHEAGFDFLHGELFSRLYNYARARNQPDPSELASEVLLKSFTRIDQFQGNEPQFKAWVFRIAHTTILDSARKRSVRPVETLVDLTPTYPAAEDTENDAVGAIALDELLSQLDVLTVDQREVVTLRIVADLTVATIAEVLDKSPEAVKALQRRAFSVLAHELGASRSPAAPAL